MWIAYRPAGTQAVVFRAGYGDSEDMLEQDFKDLTVASIGGVEADYHYYQVTDTEDIEAIAGANGTRVTESGGVPVSYDYFAGFSVIYDGTIIASNIAGEEVDIRGDGIASAVIARDRTRYEVECSGEGALIEDTFDVSICGQPAGDVTSAESFLSNGAIFYLEFGFPSIYTVTVSSELQGAVSFQTGVGWSNGSIPFLENWAALDATYMGLVTPDEGTHTVGSDDFVKWSYDRMGAAFIDRIPFMDEVGNMVISYGLAPISVDFGGGEGVVYIGNVAVAPTSNPNGGGLLYVQDGALKYRGTSGTVTTIAPA